MAGTAQKLGMLHGRVALITGGGHGIGFAIAEAMAKEGAHIAICGRSEKDLNKATLSLKKKGFVCRSYVADADDDKLVRGVIAKIKKDFKKLDILVNNIGGVKQFSNFEGLKDSDWQEVFDTNVMSMVRFSRAAFPLLRASSHGRVINIASVAGKRPGNFNPHYGAMKASMIHLSKYLSNQWGKYGILVNAVCPHTVRGGVWERDVEHKAEKMGVSYAKAEQILLKEVSAGTVLHDVALPEDVAHLAAFLATDKARFITGSCLMVDGGVVNSIF